MGDGVTLCDFCDTEANIPPSPHRPRCPEHGGMPVRKGPGRPSAFPHGTVLHRRSLRLPAEVWARLDALAAEWGTTDDGAVARLLAQRPAKT